MPLMIEGYKKDLIKFSIITCRKPEKVEAEQVFIGKDKGSQQVILFSQFTNKKKKNKKLLLPRQILLGLTIIEQGEIEGNVN